MATKTFEELKQMAIQIRDEKANKQNTATRIGTQMLEHLNKLEQEYYNKENIDEQFKGVDTQFTNLETDRIKKTTELNISVLYPTNGVGGTNRYDLTGAIAMVPTQYRTIVGLKITFINNATGKTETWKFDGGTFTTTTNWVQGDGSGGNLILEWNTDVATTRKQVLSQGRKKLLQISYVNADGDVINEQYLGSIFSDTEWVKDSNWAVIPNGSDIKILNRGINIANDNELSITRPDILEGIWIKGFKIGTNGEKVAASSASIRCTDDYIDVEFISEIGFLAKGVAESAIIAAYSDKNESSFIQSNSVFCQTEDVPFAGIWKKGDNTKYVRFTMKPIFDNISYPAFSIYKEGVLCWVASSFYIQKNAFVAQTWGQKGYIVPFHNKGIYVDFELDYNAYPNPDVIYCKLYFFSKDNLCIYSLTHIGAYKLENFFNNEYIKNNLLQEGYTTEDIAYVIVMGQFTRLKILTKEEDIKLYRNIYGTTSSSLKSKYIDKLIEAEAKQPKDISSKFNVDYSNAITIPIRNQSDLDNILYEHNEDGTVNSSYIKSGLYKAISENYESVKDYIVEFYDGTYLLSDANYVYNGFQVNSNIFNNYPDINILLRPAIGNNNVNLLTDGMQYIVSDSNIIVNKRNSGTGLREQFILEPLDYGTHYAVEYKDTFDYSSVFVGDNFEEVEVSSLDGITPLNCILDSNPIKEDNLLKFKLSSDLSWLSLTEEECEFVFCECKNWDGYSAFLTKVNKIYNGYVYVVSDYVSNRYPIDRIMLFNLPILQDNKVCIKRDLDKVVRIYIPNAISILYECIHRSGFIFIGREKTAKSISISNLKIRGNGYFNLWRKDSTPYIGSGFIGFSGVNIKINNCSIKNAGSTCIYGIDSESTMKSNVLLINNNVDNIYKGFAYMIPIKGIVHIADNRLYRCAKTGATTMGVSTSTEVYVLRNKLLDCSCATSMTVTGLELAIIESNYIKNSPSFVANYKKTLLFYDSGSIYSHNNSKSIIRYNYIDGVFGVGIYRVIYCDDGPNDKTIYGNMILRADIEDDNGACGAIAFNSNSTEPVKNTNNIVINNIITRRYGVYAENSQTPSYCGKNLLIGIGAGQLCTNQAAEKEDDVIDKQAIIIDGELYTELDIDEMFIGGEAAKHIHKWVDIVK
ncbi:hypothetical protein [uncultured Bacteroides sp.]|uniref:hypothetical protein n=1 Tax=uncultured Bacteroides sp. TaxID=162156 RepID=UPI002599FAD2|nr:hypothetical protein [uncultured Bacteroides sp.]